MSRSALLLSSLLLIPSLLAMGCADDDLSGILTLSDQSTPGALRDRQLIPIRPPLDQNQIVSPDSAMLGGYGDDCEAGADCESGFCIETNRGMICTIRCADQRDCPTGLSCGYLTNSGADITLLCVPDQPMLCEPCEASGDCDDEEDRCLALGRGQFCGESCVERECPAGYRCEDVDDIEGSGATPQCIPESGLCLGCEGLDGDG